MTKVVSYVRRILWNKQGMGNCKNAQKWTEIESCLYSEFQIKIKKLKTNNRNKKF